MSPDATLHVFDHRPMVPPDAPLSPTTGRYAPLAARVSRWLCPEWQAPSRSERMSDTFWSSVSIRVVCLARPWCEMEQVHERSASTGAFVALASLDGAILGSCLNVHVLADIADAATIANDI